MLRFSLALLLLVLIPFTSLAEEAGTVVALQGTSVLELQDGRTVGLLGVDTTGMTREQTTALSKWLEVFVLDRTVSLHYVRRTGMGRVVAAPMWRKHDVVGTMIKTGVVKLNPQGVPETQLVVWQRYSLAAKAKRLGVWAVTVPVRAVDRVLSPPYPVLEIVVPR